MTALLAILVCACFADDQAFRPKPSVVPAVPIPGASPASWDYRLSTDWTPVTRAQPVWRIAKRLEDTGTWEESVPGQPGGRFRAVIATTEDDCLTATTGRRFAGSGGVGAGFEWMAFVGTNWTAGVDVEFTPTGPRIVLNLTHYPVEGVTRGYGWSVLAGRFVHRSGWHFGADGLGGLYYLPRFLLTSYIRSLLGGARGAGR